MASVVIPGFIINRVVDPSDWLALVEVGDFKRPTEVPGRVVRGAGGRTRVIRRAGVGREWQLSFPLLTSAQVGWLEDRVGELVCVRHRRGHRMFGSFMGVDVTEVPGPDDLADVAFTVTEVTYSEAV